MCGSGSIKIQHSAGGSKGRGSLGSDGSYSLMFQIDGALEGPGPEPRLPCGQRFGPRSSVSMNP